MKPIRCSILDDEQPAVNLLSAFIERTPGLMLVATENDPDIFVDKVISGEIETDVTFADVEMDKMKGTDVAKLIQHKCFIIFSTAHSKFAEEAFNLNAVDYLRKIYDYPRFVQSVNKLKALMKTGFTNANKTELLIKASGRNVHVRIIVEDIVSLESNSGYLVIKMENEEYKTRDFKLDQAPEKLLPVEFIQVHRSFAVNMSKVKAVRGKTIIMNNLDEIAIGENYENEFMERFFAKYRGDKNKS